MKQSNSAESTWFVGVDPRENERGQTQARWRAAIASIRTWRERSRQRKQLAEMTSFQLKDIGVSRVDAWREANKPFWEA